MIDLMLLMVGLAISMVLCSLWDFGKLCIDKYERKGLMFHGKKIPLWYFEHYHWGLILLFTRFPLLMGLGLGFIIDERFHNHGSHSFAIGSGHCKGSFLIGVVIIAGGTILTLLNFV